MARASRWLLLAVVIPCLGALAGCAAAPAAQPNSAPSPAATQTTTSPQVAPSTMPRDACNDGPTPSASQPSEARLRLARLRIAAAERRIALLEAQWKSGATSLSEVLSASTLWFQAYRESGIVGPELARAAATHRQRMATTVALVEARFRAGAAGEADRENAAYGLAEAEFWQEEARERTRRFARSAPRESAVEWTHERGRGKNPYGVADRAGGRCSVGCVAPPPQSTSVSVPP